MRIDEDAGEFKRESSREREREFKRERESSRERSREGTTKQTHKVVIVDEFGDKETEGRKKLCGELLDELVVLGVCVQLDDVPLCGDLEEQSIKVVVLDGGVEIERHDQSLRKGNKDQRQ